MYFNSKEYMELESDTLPHVTNWEFTLQEIKGKCCTCGKELKGMKQTISDYYDFSVIRGVGICPPCKLIVTVSPLKITGQGKSFLFKNGQWVETSNSWLNKLLNWFKNELV